MAPDPAAARIIRWVVGTGHPYPAEWKHVGTALAADGAFVWHLMELP